MGAMMVGPNGRSLPVAIGAASSAMSGGDRGESITSDTGNRPAVPRTPPAAAAPRESITEPRDDEEAALSAEPAPHVEVVDAPMATDEEIDELHARFDQIESLIKRKLAVMTLNARFDALEAWLNARFPG